MKWWQRKKKGQRKKKRRGISPHQFEAFLFRTEAVLHAAARNPPPAPRWWALLEEPQ